MGTITLQNKSLNQTKDQWAAHIVNGGSADIENVSVTDGGVLLYEGSPNSADTLNLKNIWNTHPTGKYIVMLWPNPGSNAPKLVWDNSHCPHPIIQGPNEAAFRLKCDDAHIIGVKFQGFVKDGNPWKQVVQCRSSKKQIVFTACEFRDSPVDIGQQQTQQPDGSSHYETSQHVARVVFDNCKFTYKDMILRHPGVDKIEFINCFDHAGHKFTKTI